MSCLEDKDNSTTNHIQFMNEHGCPHASDKMHTTHSNIVSAYYSVTPNTPHDKQNYIEFDNKAYGRAVAQALTLGRPKLIGRYINIGVI